MFSVADYFHFNDCILSGSSMGAATALYGAINHPDRVLGLILVRPPTAWGKRMQRREKLIKIAESLDENPSEPFHLVIRAAAASDLPSPDTDVELYSRIKCPVLILAHKMDDSHPVSTAETLHRLIPQSMLYIANDIPNAKSEWPSVIHEFTSQF